MPCPSSATDPGLSPLHEALTTPTSKDETSTLPTSPSSVALASVSTHYSPTIVIPCRNNFQLSKGIVFSEDDEIESVYSESSNFAPSRSCSWSDSWTKSPILSHFSHLGRPSFNSVFSVSLAFSLASIYPRMRLREGTSSSRFLPLHLVSSQHSAEEELSKLTNCLVKSSLNIFDTQTTDQRLASPLTHKNIIRNRGSEQQSVHSKHSAVVLSTELVKKSLWPRMHGNASSAVGARKKQYCD
nr:hypothetical protein L203_03412 [Cryptococcus depauperatus CBS 7841]